MRTALIFLVVIGLVVGGAAYYGTQLSAEAPVKFRTAMIDRGDVASIISATGTLEPEEVVDVGAQVAGLIKSFGVDPRDPNKLVDYRSIVEEGTILANIDDTAYKAQVDQARATLLRSQADLLELEAKSNQAEKEWKRAESLVPMKAIADTDYDLDVANYEVAKANVEVGKATIEQNKAELRMAETNLGYTTIKSPVRGEIIDRRVNIGQTVVASLSAPSLFLIAKDLSRMQLWSSVNEADIGKIYVDMPVKFTVDAFPDETFDGKVSQIRLNAQTTQNVVTYTVVVTTDNSSRRLLPYLTANLRFQVDQHQDVLLVPNVALRWKPRLASQIAPDYRKSTSSKKSDQKDSKETASEEKTSDVPKGKKPDKDQADRAFLWVKDGDFVRPIEVQIGLSDGSVTEVSGEGLHEGVEVVVGERRATDTAGDSDTTNPFLPKLRPSGTSGAGGTRSK